MTGSRTIGNRRREAGLPPEQWTRWRVLRFRARCLVLAVPGLLGVATLVFALVHHLQTFYR
jgi:hypothetical protein